MREKGCIKKKIDVHFFVEKKKKTIQSRVHLYVFKHFWRGSLHFGTDHWRIMGLNENIFSCSKYCELIQVLYLSPSLSRVEQ